ncbi:MAG: class I SAM-dependent methyltransferase [Parachlamydiales bacterium]
MGQEIDLLKNYPKAKRDVKARAESKTEEDRKIARQFGRDFFDGDRKHGYGGYNYHPRFWQPVVPDFQKFYNLGPGSLVLDIGCGKGFMLYDFQKAIPGLKVRGIDVSGYAIENSLADIKPALQVADARSLPFEDDSFDLVISINTVHNLEKEELALALKEIERVSRKDKFITVDAYRNEAEKKLMLAWNLTARTIMHVDEWKAFFQEAGYQGDYYWFMP